MIEIYDSEGVTFKFYSNKKVIGLFFLLEQFQIFIILKYIV